MSKKFNMDCAAERIVNKIYLKYREYIVDEFIKIDWSFFEDGDKEKILTDEDFFGLICSISATLTLIRLCIKSIRSSNTETLETLKRSFSR